MFSTFFKLSDDAISALAEESGVYVVRSHAYHIVSAPDFIVVAFASGAMRQF